MAETPPTSPRRPTSTKSAGRRAEVHLEVRHGAARPLLYAVTDAGFLIGSVTGCDLRLPGVDLPPLLGLVARGPDGVSIRKLVPTVPMTVNGKGTPNGPLVDNDRVTLGPVELVIHISPPPSDDEHKHADFQKQEEALHQERDHWQLQRAEQEKKLAERIRQTEASRLEFAALRKEHYERYRERRDRLAGLQEAVNRAAAKVQERKRQVDAEEQQAAARRQEDAAWRAEVEARAAELTQARQRLQEEVQAAELRRQEQHQQLDQRQAELASKDRQLAEDRQHLEKSQAQYQADVLRLDRWAASLEERQQQLQERTREVDTRLEQLQRDSHELDDQARQLDAWHSKLTGEAERISRQKAEVQTTQADVTKRAAALEGQQAMLAQLRTRVERMREDVRREEQLLTEQRARQEETEAELLQKVQDIQRRSAEFSVEKGTRDEEVRRLEERQAILDAAVVQLRQMQDNVHAEEEQLRLRTAALDAQAAQQAEEAALLKARSVQAMEMQERLSAERQALREREATLAQAELAREALQEQLRRRSDELAERQRILAEKERNHADAAAMAEARRAEVEHFHRESQERLALLQQEAERQSADAAHRNADLSQREQLLQQHVERLKASGRAIAQARKRLSDQRQDVEAEHQRVRADLESVQQEAAELDRQVAQWEAQAQAATEHLTRARDQLRGHLAELHAYARQAQEDLERMRAQVRTEADQQGQQELALHRARDEHHLAVAAFRQQLIDWQGKVVEMKQALSQNESRLVRRQAEVDATSARLAKQAEQLQAQERAVSERREEMDRHLADMQEWYRRKLRELTERYFADTAIDANERAYGGASQNILALTSEVDPGDRHLGELLRSLNLVETETLTALLVEARKQRQSLRQVLLASGCVTLYQMALIEAGNLDGLMLGPVRVMDRLRVTARETVYRVLDPRRVSEQAGGAEGYSVLRHLADSEMEDAVHPDEFRQRFAAAARVQHPHLAATLEVLEIQGRPAVLQEWVTGLAAPDWPALFAVSGVWFRLLCQAALGLQTAHQAGLVHGHLHPSLLVLTGEGVLKICGLGEPLWLAMPEALPVGPAQDEARLDDDLTALGQIALTWTRAPARRKGARGRPLAKPLQAVLERLGASVPEMRYPSAAALLEDLDRVSAEVPPNPEAWDRLLHYVRDHIHDERPLRQSA
jgi:chromosome segregation ATPase